MKTELPITPEIGMGATSGAGSDCYPYTIVEIISPKTIVVQADTHTPTDKHDYYNNQDYTYERNPNGYKMVVTLRKNGRWVCPGQSMWGTGVSIGHRRYYQDPSF